MAIKSLSVRLPDNLHQLIQQAADQDRRSINSEVLWLIETGLSARKDRQ